MTTLARLARFAAVGAIALMGFVSAGSAHAADSTAASPVAVSTSPAQSPQGIGTDWP